MVNRRLAVVVVVCCSMACTGSEGDERAHCEPISPSWIDADARVRQYVVDSIKFPTDADEAVAYGQNLDGDELGRKDNALGQILALVFPAFDSDLNDTVASLVRDGRIIHLISLRANEIDHADGVGLRLFTGTDADQDPTNNLGGAGQFVLGDTSSTVELSGDIRDSRLRANLGAVPLQILFSDDAEPVTMTLHAATVDVTMASDGTMAGLLGGTFTKQQIDDEFMPIVHALLAAMVIRDCSGTIPNCCPDDSQGATVVGLFDSDPADCTVTLEEVTSSNLVKALLTPELDLFDERGRYNPLCDGEKEGLSLGLSFTAVPAAF